MPIMKDKYHLLSTTVSTFIKIKNLIKNLFSLNIQ